MCSKSLRVMFTGIAPAMLVAAAAHAQCVEIRAITDPEQGYSFTPDGFVETVAGVIAWDPDGPEGPREPWTVLHGAFRRGATALGNGVVAFDGERWGYGLPGPQVGTSRRVESTWVHNGDLYARTNLFDPASGTDRVWSRWDDDGGDWVAAGPQIFNGRFSNVNPPPVVSFRGQIVVIGLESYRTGDSVPPPFSLLTRPDGDLWQPVGPPVSEFSGTARAAVVGGSGANESLFIGGTLTGTGVNGPISNIARWDGTQLSALGAGLNGEVSDIWVEGTSVYATGVFTQSGQAPVIGVGVWNGSTWQQVGDGSLTNARSVAVHEGSVYVVAREGNFENVYRLADNAWVPDGRTDLPVPPQSTAAFSAVTLDVANGRLFMVGRFRGVNARAIQSAAVRENGEWRPVSGGFNRETNMVYWNGRVLASGAFTRAGREFVPGVAEWDGHRWGPTDVPPPPGSLVTAGDGLYSLARLPGRVFAYVNEEWVQLGGDLRSIDGSRLNPLHLEFFQGSLYLGVTLEIGESAPSGINLLRWNGTQWQPVGGRITRESGFPQVLGLASVQDRLYVSVGANALDGVPFTGGLLQWNGEVLEVVPHAGSTPVEMISSGDQLEVIRRIPRDGQPPDYATFVLDGLEWTLTGFLPQSTPYRYLTDLRAIGEERFALAQDINQTETLVRLDRETATWVDASAPISIDRFAPIEFDTGQTFITPLVVGSEIHLFGSFRGLNQNSAVNWARFTTGAPLVLAQPADVITSCGTPVVLSANIASGYDSDPSFEVQWLRNGQPIADGPNYAGATSATLTIASLSEETAGFYALRARTECGTTTTRETLVSGDSAECRACAACVADFDLDGGVTGADVAAFIDAFEISGACADLDGDGGVSGADLAAFFAAYQTGGC